MLLSDVGSYRYMAIIITSGGNVQFKISLFRSALALRLNKFKNYCSLYFFGTQFFLVNYCITIGNLMHHVVFSLSTISESCESSHFTFPRRIFCLHDV